MFKTTSFLIFVFLFTLPTETIANGICIGDRHSHRMTLKDIEFCVQISAEESSLNNIKALMSELKEEMERELWKEGIKILPEKDCLSSPRLILYINLLELQNVIGFVFNLDLRLQQKFIWKETLIISLLSLIIDI